MVILKGNELKTVINKLSMVDEIINEITNELKVDCKIYEEVYKKIILVKKEILWDCEKSESYKLLIKDIFRNIEEKLKKEQDSLLLTNSPE